MVISSKTVASMSPATLRWKKFSNFGSKYPHVPPTARTWQSTSPSIHLAHDKVLHPSVSDPCELCWVKQGGRYQPNLSVDPVATEAVVELLKCNCGVSFCSRGCTCRQNNLPCTNVCKCEASEHCMNTHTHEQIEDIGTEE